MKNPQKIFYAFLVQVGFTMSSKQPFRKCKVGYKSIKDSKLGTFIFNIQNNQITQIRIHKVYNGQDYNDELIFINYKISQNDNLIKINKVA